MKLSIGKIIGNIAASAGAQSLSMNNQDTQRHRFNGRAIVRLFGRLTLRTNDDRK